MHQGLARQVVRQRAADGFRAGVRSCSGQGRVGTRRLLLGRVLLEIFEAQFELRDLGIQALGRSAVLLTPERGQLRPQVLDFDRRRAELRARRGQLVPQGGDLVLGRVIGQVHTAILPDGRLSYNRDHPRERGCLLTRQLPAAPSRRACASRSPPAASTPARPST
jgi:hypothetical protein